jgi:thymidylate synthase (FAD)
MSVKLVSLTSAEGMKPEEIISYCARVSNPKNQSNFGTAPALLKYCIENKHWSPFEMADMTVEITTSRAIAQQILRHRSFQFQEFSQRYAKAFEYVECQARRQDSTNRQNSIDDLSPETKMWFKAMQAQVWSNSESLYKEALERGIAKECARFLLPLNTMTKLYMKGSVRSWIHYLQIRTDAATQKEHRDIAEGVKKIFVANFPSISEAMGWKNG